MRPIIVLLPPLSRSPLLVLLVAVLIPFVVALVFIPPQQWRLIDRPPLPSGAVQIETLYPSHDRSRVTRFAIDQSTSLLQAFYRTELPNHDWQYRCAVTFDPRFQEDIELIEVYAQDGTLLRSAQTLEVVLFQQGASVATGETRMVELEEWAQPFQHDVCTAE